MFGGTICEGCLMILEGLTRDSDSRSWRGTVGNVRRLLGTIVCYQRQEYLIFIGLFSGTTSSSTIYSSVNDRFLQ